MKKWTREEIGFLKESIGKLTYEEMAKKTNRTRCSVIGRCRYMGLSNSKLKEKTIFKSKYKVNDEFFSDFNVLSCYYAGLIASDGTVNKKSNAIAITQSENRLDSLKKFKKDVNYSGIIYGPRKTIGQNSYTMVISSKKWKEDLKNNFMITPKKSLTLKAPKLKNKKLIISFIIGLIDGDGSVGTYKYKNKKDIVPIITFCGTKNIVEWVCCSLNSYFNIKNLKLSYRQITESTYFLSFSGRRVIKFYQYIIENKMPFMFCKWEKMINRISIKGLDYYLKDKREFNRRDKNGKFYKFS
jgi:hypothetical protein